MRGSSQSSSKRRDEVSRTIGGNLGRRVTLFLFAADTRATGEQREHQDDWKPIGKHCLDQRNGLNAPPPGSPSMSCSA